MRPYAFLVCSLLITCWSAAQDLPAKWPAVAWSVLPSPELLEAGVVNKYYFHYLSADGYDKSTDIRYHAYELLPGGALRITIYGPGLDKISEMDFTIREHGMYCRRAQQYWRGKPKDTQVEKGGWLDWYADSAQFVSLTDLGGSRSEYLQLQQKSLLVDTTLLNRPAKRVVFERQRDYSYPDQDSRHYESTYTDYYASGLGLAQRDYTFADARGQLELVRQLSGADFALLRARVPKRVAYIDPDQTLDQYGYFKPCNEDPTLIYDYYNGEVDAGFKGGKRGLEKALRNKIKKRFLLGESGYLTFRFVINCEGETGWFLTEQAGLNYEPKAFAPGTVQHVYEILKGLRNWQPGILRGEVIDSYAYVTLKINNGEIVEILP